MARDIGWNYLQSLPKNAIVINYGDNDTFPLWFNQEVDGVRPDVRIMNSSYLGGEWYIDEMKTAANDAAPVPFSLPSSKYSFVNDALPVRERVNRVVEIDELMEFIKSENESTKLPLVDGTMMDYVPARRIAIPVNKENAVKSGIVKEEDYDLMVDTVYINIAERKQRIEKSEMMLLDLLANFDWNRPICFTQVYILQDFGLLDYLQFDGYAYRLVPILTPYRSAWDIGRIDTDVTYPLLKMYSATVTLPRRVFTPTTSRSIISAHRVPASRLPALRCSLYARVRRIRRWRCWIEVWRCCPRPRFATLMQIHTPSLRVTTHSASGRRAMI